jgi:GT2 family glycosyltransferase
VERTYGLKPLTIDVIVPTVRPNPRAMRAILGMDVPLGVDVNYYIVVDNPKASVRESVSTFGDRENVKILRNDGNLGAHISRNRGLDEGTSDYLLFLDDDVEPYPTLLQEYREAIERYPDAPGFVGSSRFPNPVNSFTRGTLASDILTFWAISETRSELAWGITANLLVSRKAIGPICFSPKFPKRGGGEDIDFCLNIVSRTEKLFRAAPKASVHHPWWNDGSRQYRRFARWAYGDGQLPTLHRRYRYYNAPNMVETLFLGALVLIPAAGMGLVSLGKVAAFFALVGLIEFGAEAVRLRSRQQGARLLTSVEATLVRISSDVGRITGNLKRRHLLCFGERFDYFVTGESIKYERKVAVPKFFLFVAAAFAVLLLFQNV